MLLLYCLLSKYTNMRNFRGKKEERIKKMCNGFFFLVKSFEACFCLNATVDWMKVAQDE
jgi:hypothetical protein